MITVDLSLNLHTALHCPNAVRPHDTKRSESETDSYEPNQAKDSSHETTGDPNEKAAPFLETESFSITQANIHQHKEEKTQHANKIDQAQDSSHETTGDPNEKAAAFLETESFSITQASIHQHKEENTEDSNITVNAIKSKIRKILNATVFTGGGRKALFKCKLSRSILHLVTEEEPETKSSMIQTISRVITEELISRAERGGRSPCSTSWKVLLKKRPPK